MSQSQRTANQGSSTTPTKSWHTEGTKEALHQNSTSPTRGLTNAQVREKLAKYGDNSLAEKGGRTLLQIVWEQASSVMIAILVVAGVLAIILGKPIDAVAILCIVVLFVILGIIQEYRAQKAIAALKRMSSPTVRAIRDGRSVEIPATALVPGDIVKLEAGGVVPADCRVLEVAALRIQEAALTGESEPVEKTTEALEGATLPLGDRTNMAYRGTFVSYGRGLALVVETGMRTELGRIAELIQSIEHEATPLQRRLDGLGKSLAVVAAIVAVIIVVAGLLRGEPIADLMLTGISLAVAIVPEGLPAVLTFTLALGAQRMLRRNALIRRLPAVETLGSVTVICSDKTGTLTQNKMTVMQYQAFESELKLEAQQVSASFAGQRSALALLAAGGALCGDATLESIDGDGTVTSVGDPTEMALVVGAARLGLLKSELEAKLPRVAEISFDSDRKLMTTIHRNEHPEWKAASPAPFLVLTKGAPDNLLAVCDKLYDGSSVRPLGEGDRQYFMDRNAESSSGGKRVLAVAFRGLDTVPAKLQSEVVERGLVFLGLSAMIDPPRLEAKEAVARCATAGIRAIMITGDHPITALAIARELGIAQGDSVALTGQQLAEMNKDELDQAVKTTSIFARVSPEHKLRIVGALQEQGEVVAMTGDGVNDAPALKKADIGVAMGTGTDVAKEAADMVLVDDNFATIVGAVEEGRVVFDNLRRFIMFSISGNLSKVLIVAFPPLLGLPLLLRPIQVLWSNLMTDGLLGVGMGVEQPERDVMTRPPVDPRESMLNRHALIHIGAIGSFMGLALIGLAVYLLQTGAPNWQTMVFTSLATMQAGRAWGVRSFVRSAFLMNPLTNLVLLSMLLVVLSLQLAVVYLPPLQPYFHTLALSPVELLIAAGLGVLMYGFVELEKHLAWGKSSP
ncbi:MAG: cation-translocating P-type ATPase [Candidatus Sumerlaeia bacterium]|nr:cation-translocating P-type ATPase [Candidatus Sumerlaeia bacterium]